MRANLLRIGLIGSWVCFEQTRAISGNTRSFQGEDQSFQLLEEDKYWELWKSGSMYAAFGNSGSRERISADNYSNSLHNSCFIIRAFLLKKLLFPTVHLGQYSWIPLKPTLRNDRAHNGTFHIFKHKHWIIQLPTPNPCYGVSPCYGVARVLVLALDSCVMLFKYYFG